MNLKVTDFVKMEGAFSFSNQMERNLFKQSEEELKKRITEVRRREDFITLFTKVSNYIQNLAKTDGIFNLVITSDSKELKVKAGSLSTDKRSLEELLNFSAQRLNMIRKQQEMNDRNRRYLRNQNTSQTMQSGISSLVKGVKYHTIWISFSGELKNALDFINHLPWSDDYIREDKIIVSKSDFLPYYIVSLKIYYIDLRTSSGDGTMP